MGFKRITEKDFWKCTEGAMYAPIQGTRKSTTQSTGEAFITEVDTATLSWIDFGCTKNMFLAAIITAIVVVAAVVVVTVLVVGTGGLALGPLMMIGAAAATFAGTVAAVDGALKCGQKNATQREWNERDQSMISQGVRTITGDRYMTCKIGGTVQYAPNVKSWGDAIALGGLNYVTKLAECALGGAAVGAAGYLLPSLAGGQIAFAMPTWGSVATNIGTGFTGVWGASRALFGINALANDGAMGKVEDGWDALSSVGNAAVPEIGMGRRIVTGQAQPTDYLLFLYLLNFKPGRNATPPKEEKNLNNKDKDNTVDGDNNEVPQSKLQGEGNKNGKVKDGDGSPYEVEPISSKIKGDLGEAKVIENLKAQGYTDVVQVQNNSGHGVDVIARNPKTGAVKCVEVKANTSQLSEHQRWGGKKYVQDRLDRAVSGKGYNKIPPNPAELKTNAQKAKDWIQDAPQVDYEVHQVPVDNATGVAGTPKVSPWDPKPKK